VRAPAAAQVRDLPHGVALETLVTGHGDPVTVFAHGLGGGLNDTRPFGSGIRGSKVFFQFRGHGRSAAPPGPWTYADLAADLRAVADSFGARRALGVSLGAGALCRLLAQTPDRFDRLVFVLPAALDEERGPLVTTRIRSLLDAVDAGDLGKAADILSYDIPVALRDTPAAWAYLRERLDGLFRDGLSPRLADLPGQAVLPDVSVLAEVAAPTLVIGCSGDRAHPAHVAERLAALLPHATLHLYDRPGLLWNQRADLRRRIAAHLNPSG
jgi:pimeloyl-ACP methyl ester carboxylesterase